MAKPMLSDELWAVIEPLLPPVRVSPKGGRPRVPNRAVRTGILFVLRTGLAWDQLPLELGCGSGMTCWRRLCEWQAAGVWAKRHRVFLDWLGDADQSDWSRAAIDSTTVPAPKGAQRPGRIQRIAANRARSAMVWSTGKGFRSPLRSRRLMSTLSICCCLPLTHSLLLNGRRAVPASGRRGCMPIQPVMPPPCAASCAGGGSFPALRAGASSPRSDWAAIAG